jgi:hypothetical protein
LAICVDPRPEAVRSGIVAALSIAKSLDPETSRRAQTEAMPYERRQGIRPIVYEITNRVRSGQPA